LNDDFPNGFRIQRVKLPAAPWLADLPAEDIAKYFHGNLAAAKDLLQESYDKRYTPSSFISEENYGFSAGWLSRRSGYMSVRRFDTLADAATDYLLFSLGKGRWAPPASDRSSKIVF